MASQKIDMSMHQEKVKWERTHVSTWTPYHENGQLYSVFNSGFSTLTGMFDEIQRRHGSKIMLVDETGNRMTYSQVFDNALILARALLSDKRFNLCHGDRVAVCSRNSFDWIICYLAACYAGMIAIPMNSWWTPREIDYAVKHSDCKLIFADRERIARIQKIDNFSGRVVAITDTELDGNGQVQVVPLADLFELGKALPADLLKKSGFASR